MPVTLAAAIAVNRFGLGARPGELDAAAKDPKDWLARQITNKSAFELTAQGLLTTRAAAEALSEYLQDLKVKTEGKAGKLSPEDQEEAILKPLKQLRDINISEIEARTQHALTTQTSFAERLVLFW